MYKNLPYLTLMVVLGMTHSSGNANALSFDIGTALQNQVNQQISTATSQVVSGGIDTLFGATQNNLFGFREQLETTQGALAANHAVTLDLSPILGLNTTAIGGKVSDLISSGTNFSALGLDGMENYIGQTTNLVSSMSLSSLRNLTSSEQNALGIDRISRWNEDYSFYLTPPKEMTIGNLANYSYETLSQYGMESLFGKSPLQVAGGINISSFNIFGNLSDNLAINYSDTLGALTGAGGSDNIAYLKSIMENNTLSSMQDNFASLGDVNSMVPESVQSQIGDIANNIADNAEVIAPVIANTNTQAIVAFQQGGGVSNSLSGNKSGAASYDGGKWMIR